MGSYDEDAWMRCVVCRRWEADFYFLHADGFGGVVCPRCYFNRPPHSEYLQGVFRSMLSHEITDRVATFAYYWCARAEAAAYSMEADSQIEDDADDVILCPVCDPEWLGWYCMFCSLTVGE